MGKKKKTVNQIKKEKEEKLNEAYQQTLVKVKTKLSESESSGSKRKDPTFLKRYFEINYGNRFARRSVLSYHGRSYNLRKQVLDLATHIFVLFPTPLFLYRAILSKEGHQLVFDPDDWETSGWKENQNREYVRWFAVTAQGGSLAKEMKGILTKKEVHWFLKAPAHNTIGRNLFWARCASAGVPLDTCQFLTEQLGSIDAQKSLGSRIDDLIRFYANYARNMRGNDLQELTDFVRMMIRDRTFSFKGRTLCSMMSLCHEWHRNYYLTRVEKFESWKQTFSPWTSKEKNYTVHAIEITTNKALADEGKRQRHCVLTYTSNCLQSSSKIVSMRWVLGSESMADPTNIVARITMEIRPSSREIVQIRGKHNRSATDLEMKTIQLWAADHGLKIGQWAN